PDGQTVFVANGAENAIAVVDADGTGDDAVRGLIPTGWYPTAVALDRSGSQRIVANGDGFGSIAPTPPARGAGSYGGRSGIVSMLNVADRGQLDGFTQQVRRNNRGLPPDADGNDGDHGHDGGEGGSAVPIPRNIGQGSPIKHVFYIIKENRTYD